MLILGLRTGVVLPLLISALKSERLSMVALTTLEAMGDHYVMPVFQAYVKPVLALGTTLGLADRRLPVVTTLLYQAATHDTAITVSTLCAPSQPVCIGS